MRTKIVIIGGGGTAVNIAEAISDSILKQYLDAELLGFANDELEKVDDYNVVIKIKNLNQLYKYNDIKYIFALYKPDLMVERSILFRGLNIPQEKMFGYAHHSCFISNSAKVMNGVIMLPNSIVLNNSKIGIASIINSGVIVEHDSIIGNNCFIGAGAIIGSNVKIGNNVFLGLNSSVRENITIENNAFLGIHSLAITSIKENEIWYGVPAKKK